MLVCACCNSLGFTGMLGQIQYDSIGQIQYDIMKYIGLEVARSVLSCI